MCHKLIAPRRAPVTPCAPTFILFLLLPMLLGQAYAGGTWAPLAHAPPAGLNNCLLMSDGTLMCGDGGSGWYRLTPDIHGSYVNGTWSALAATHYTRLFYSSDVLTSGFLYVAGGEYGTGKDHAELYNSLLNTWSDIPQPASDPTYSDAVSKILPNGNVLQGTTGGGTWIYNPTANTITAGPTARNQNEACWVKLTNDCVLTVDAFGTQSEHYVPSANAWVNDGTVPVELYGWGGEMGAGFLLPNGNVFYIGGTTHTAIYTPGATVSTAGTWVAGPEMIFGTNGLGAVDAPSAMMANGKILCVLGPTNGFSGPSSFYEYDYTTNGFTQVNGPTGLTLGNAPFVMTMLCLPDGNILMVSGQGSTQLYVYTPDGTPLAAGQPAINSITENTDGSYHLTGTGLNGITGGAAYGDDWQMDSNYPLVRLTNTVSGNVYYARTFGWNSTSVMTGSRIVTTEFSLPLNLPEGSYSLVVVANGNPSASIAFSYSPSAAPTGLSAVIGNSRLTLSWNSVPGATAYDLKRSSTRSGPYAALTTTTGTNYLNLSLTNGIPYYYVVSAVSSGGPSTNSAELTATPFGPPPMPTGLTAGPDSYPGIALAWNSSPAAASYNVKRSTINGGPYSVIVNRSTPDYDDTNVTIGTPYYYVVSAVSAGGESLNSSQAIATAAIGGDVTTGLVANWRFDDGTGTTAADSTANNNTGTLVNGPTWVAPGRIGASALSFVATNTQSVTVANSTSLDMTSGITIAAWINATDWGGNRRILQKGNSDNQYRFLAENGVFKFHLNGVNTLTAALPNTNVWVHVAGTWNGLTMVIYTNGQVQASLATGGSIATTADPLAIGTKNGSTTAGDLFNGELDEVRVYNRALGMAEINTLMHSGDGAPATPTGVTAAAANSVIGLSWNAISNATTYNVKRSTSNGGPYTNIAAPFTPAYTDAGLSNGTTYYYVVSAVNFTNESANSAQVSARPGVGVTFYQAANYNGAASQILGPGNYTLSQLSTAGSPNDSASSCRIPTGWTVVIYQNDGFGGATWTLTSDTPNFTAYSGLNDNMSSCKITGGSVPAAPASLTGVAGDTIAGLSWLTSAGATSYHLKRSTNSGGPYTTITDTTGTNFTDTGLADGTTYYYVVCGADAIGESANSAEISVTPILPQVSLTVGSAPPGQFSLQFQGTDGHTYIVLMSTDLMIWTPVFTNQQSGGTFIYTDTNAVDAERFYRVQE
jgi:fibronectin type 3 domain-containing protein